MSSLADLPELVGFFSYSREDDEDSHGALSALRERIQRELRGQLGRSMKTFRLWQDKEAIASGTLWEAEIKTAAEQSVFFIPIITPTVVRSPYCRFELDSFLAREAALGRSDLVFPILYIKVPALEDSIQRQNDPVLSIIAKRQYLDWREFRHRDVASTDVKEAIERFCAHICDALHRPWLPPEERQQRDEADARRRAEEEQRRQEEERRRETAAEAERQRLDFEAAATREAEERGRQAAEAERQRHERDAAATREAEEKARREERRKNEEDQRQRDEAETKQRSEQTRAFAAAKYDDTVLAVDNFLTAQLRRLPSRRVLLTACVLSVVVLVGSVGFWHRTPVPPKETAVQPSPTTVPPAADAEAKRRAEEAEQQRQATLKAEEERADAKRIAEAASNDAFASVVRRQQDLKATLDSLDKRILTELGAPDGKRNDALIASLRAESARTEQSILETSARIAREFPARAEANAPSDPALAVKPGSGQGFRDRLANGQPCPMCPEMVVVPAGSFTMGSPTTEDDRDSDEGPQHTVTFARQLAVGRFAVTFDEWDACTADGGCNGYKPEDEGWGRGRRPVIKVSWDAAKAYVAWLSGKTGKTYRLLSEAEREYVTRAGTTGRFWWGSSISKSQANYGGHYTYRGSVTGKTLPVDAFQPNPWGLYQVHGNVWEWVEDCSHDNYVGAPSDGSAWTYGLTAQMTNHCSKRVLRGGSWDDGPEALRSASHHSPYNPQIFNPDIGFRVGRTLTP